MLRLVLGLLLSLLLGAVNAQSNSVDAGLEWAKKKCVDLGFKSGTERYGNCVLQLSREDPRAGSSPPQLNIQPPPVTSIPATPPSLTSKGPKVPSFRDRSGWHEMVTIPAGTFLMGSKDDPFLEPPPDKNAQAQHQVTLKSFSIGPYEIMQEQ